MLHGWEQHVFYFYAQISLKVSTTWHRCCLEAFLDQFIQGFILQLLLQWSFLRVLCLQTDSIKTDSEVQKVVLSEGMG